MLSRGHKAQGQSQGQGHKKNPRLGPGTTLPRTDPLEAKDTNSRSQGQRQRIKNTGASAFQKKTKGLQKFFDCARVT